MKGLSIKLATDNQSLTIERAEQIIDCEQILKLSKHDAMLLVDVLEQPAKVQSKLQAAAKHYRTKKQ